MKRIVLIFLCVVICSSCSSAGAPAYISKSEYLLGTLVSFRIYDFGEADKSIIDDCFSMIAEYEQIFSYNRSDSELSRLNQSAFNNPVNVSDELFDIVYRSLEYCEKTDGAFDIGLGKLIDIWENASAAEIPPTEEELSDFIGFNAYKHIIADDTEKTIMFTDERVSVHLGACAKGYLEDVALMFLKNNGVKSAVLDFGGSIAVLGDKAGEPFVIGISDPVKDGSLVGTVLLSDKTVVTSGDYRRYFVYDGIRYHHILDYKTACPAFNDINGVSVVCASAFAGDCLSTAAFVLGSDAASELIISEECGYVIVTDDSLYSSGVVFLNENE